MTFRGSIAGVLLVPALALAGCAGSTDSAQMDRASSSQAGPTDAPPVGVDYLREKDYHRLGELMADADLVAVVQPTGAAPRRADIAGVPFSLYDVEVVKTYKGKSPGQLLTMRQLGAPDIPAEHVTYVEADRRYMVFLQRLTFDGVDSGLWEIAGTAAGLYKGVGSKFHRTDGHSVDLPAEIRESDVEQRPTPR